MLPRLGAGPKTRIFKLRRGVKSHEGSNSNIEIARFNFTGMKTEPKSVREGEVASIDSVDVVDGSTIKINLKRPDAVLLATPPIAPSPGWDRREDEVRR